MDDNSEIALLAHQSNIGLQQIYQKPVQRIDPRQFINNPYGGHAGRPVYPAQQPYYPSYQPSMGGVEDYGLPSSLPPQMSQLPMVMRDRDGNIIDLSQTPSVSQDFSQNNYPPQNSSMSDVRGFQIPDYSKYNKISNNNHETSESVLDIILKEIKSLKKAVNKLIRETEKSKLPVSKLPQQLDIDDTNSQPKDISEGISSSNFGD